MLEDPTTLAAVAASTGFIIGYGLKTIMVNRKAPRKGRSFTAKQLERWHCKKKWADILLKKDKMQYAESEMDLLNQGKVREEKKSKLLYKERDDAIAMLNEFRQQAMDAVTEVEEKAVLQSMGPIAATLSSIRRRLDGVSNTYVTHHQRMTFLEFVMRDDSMSDIIEGMDMIDLKGVIENNSGHGMEIYESEIQAMGSKKAFSELKSALKMPIK
tara:strand:- start:3609 stop:4250 length:642 start_codon:yes stop_codon:yes gene_type:complete